MRDAAILRTWRTTLALAVLGVVPTLGRFANGLVFDDRFVITEGTFVFDPANLARLWALRTMAASAASSVVGAPALDTYRPISILTFFWDAAISGRDPTAYHTTNALLHGAVVAALHRLLIAQARGHAVVAPALTLAFAWSPWLTEAHVWIDGRSDPLCALGLLLATAAHARSYGKGGAWSIASGCGLLFALLSKEAALLAAPCIAFAPSHDAPSWRARLLRSLPLAVAVAIYAALRVHALHGARVGGGTTTLSLAALNGGTLALDALLHLAVPLPYHLASLWDAYREIDATLRVSVTIAVVLAGAVALVAATRSRRLRVRWGLLFFAATMIAPVAVTGSSWPGFGRFLYVPAIGVAVAVAELIEPLVAGAHARVVAIAAAVLLAGSGLASAQATTLFRDDATYFGDAMRAYPEQAWTYGFFGLYVARGGDCARALPALETATVGAPDDARYLVQLGECLRSVGDVGRARAVALDGEHRFAGTRPEAGFLLLHASTLGPPQAALAHELLARCLALAPERTDCRDALRVVGGGR